MFLCALLQAGTVFAADADGLAVFDGDPHRNAMGFFDVHLCNWPQRPQFLKVLFSTTHFAEIASMEVYSPDGRKITDLSADRYKLVLKRGKPEKRVFMMDIDVPAGSADGWYYIVVKGRDGKEYRARDFLILNRLARPGGMVPHDGAEDVPVQTDLRWDPVPGAAYYKVFVRDEFEDVQVVESGLLREARYVFKPGTLKPGGYYSWKVHARDVDGNVMLGDFNSGSIGPRLTFSVADH